MLKSSRTTSIPTTMTTFMTIFISRDYSLASYYCYISRDYSLTMTLQMVLRFLECIEFGASSSNQIVAVATCFADHPSRGVVVEESLERRLLTTVNFALVR